MKLISIKKQKFILFIPYIGLFIAAIIQTINLTKIKDFEQALKTLFKTLMIPYIVGGIIYTYYIHPIIYNKNEMTLTIIYVVILTNVLHILVGLYMLDKQSVILDAYKSEQNINNENL